MSKPDCANCKHNMLGHLGLNGKLGLCKDCTESGRYCDTYSPMAEEVIEVEPLEPGRTTKPDERVAMRLKNLNLECVCSHTFRLHRGDGPQSPCDVTECTCDTFESKEDRGKISEDVKEPNDEYLRRLGFRTVEFKDVVVKPDPTNPSHYRRFGDVEVIDITEQLNFNRGNAVKYLARAGFKEGSCEIEDLKKARWYVEREIARLEK